MVELKLVVNMEQRTEKYTYASIYDIKQEVDRILAEEEQYMELEVYIDKVCLYESDFIDPTENNFDTDDMETDIYNELELYISDLEDLLR